MDAGPDIAYILWLPDPVLWLILQFISHRAGIGHKKAINLACANGHLDVVRMLIERFPGVADRDSVCLWIRLANWDAHVSVVKYLLSLKIAPVHFDYLRDACRPGEKKVR